MLKNLSFALVLIFCGGLGFAQQKFYTNNFTKEVTQLTTSLKTVQFSTKLPDAFKKYDDIVSVIDIKDEGTGDYYTLNFYYNVLPVSEVPAGGILKYKVYEGPAGQSDFTTVFRDDLDESFDLMFSQNYKARTFQYQTVAVKVMGRKQDGMHWVNNEYVPKYNYDELSFTEIKLDLGTPEKTFSSTNGLFTFEKFVGKARTKIISEEASDDLSVIYSHGDENPSTTNFSIYEIKAGEIQQESFDMSGGAPEPSGASSVEEMKNEIKLNLKKSLIKSSCYNEARSVKLEGQRIATTKIQEGIYQPYMLDAGNGSGKGGSGLASLKSIGGSFGKQGDQYNKFVESPESDLNWQEKKMGNATFEVLELDLYDNDQCISSSSNKTMSLKDGQEGKTQKLIVFMGEVDGKLFVGTFSKDGSEPLNDEDLKFKESIFSTFKAN